MLSCLSLLHMCGLGLCPFSRLVYDPSLLLRGGRGGLSPECALPQEHLVSHSCRALLGGHGAVWCLTYLPVNGRALFHRALRFLEVKET